MISLLVLVHAIKADIPDFGPVTSWFNLDYKGNVIMIDRNGTPTVFSPDGGKVRFDVTVAGSVAGLGEGFVFTSDEGEIMYCTERGACEVLGRTEPDASLAVEMGKKRAAFLHDRIDIVDIERKKVDSFTAKIELWSEPFFAWGKIISTFYGEATIIDPFKRTVEHVVRRGFDGVHSASWCNDALFARLSSYEIVKYATLEHFLRSDGERLLEDKGKTRYFIGSGCTPLGVPMVVREKASHFKYRVGMLGASLNVSTPIVGDVNLKLLAKGRFLLAVFNKSGRVGALYYLGSPVSSIPV